MQNKTLAARRRPNIHDARYKNNEHLLHGALHTSLANRRINVRPYEICRAATISRPTFYAHCYSVDDALRQYEGDLQEEFHDRLPKVGCNHEAIFTVMLGFMRDAKGYFKATIPNSNYWLLQTIFEDVRPKLVSKNIGDRTYDFYVHTQIIIIGDWAKYDRFSQQRIPFYVQKMLRTRLVNPAV